MRVVHFQGWDITPDTTLYANGDRGVALSHRANLAAPCYLYVTPDGDVRTIGYSRLLVDALPSPFRTLQKVSGKAAEALPEALAAIREAAGRV